MTTLTQENVMASAVALGPAIRASADEAERNRRLPKSIIDAMTKAGIFRMFIPRSLGGLEQPLAESLRVFEELSRADASAGWVAMILSSNAVIARQLDDATVQELFGTDSLTSGIVAPLGRADIVDGGYRLTGRWPFGSGCQESPWMSAGAMAWENGNMRMLPIGMPDWRLFAFPASDAEIIDTWHVSGLRATGSHDIAVSDIFVPANRVISIVEDEPTRQGPLYAVPVLGLFGAVVGSVALGTAQRAIDEITELAATKVPAGAMTPLAEQATGQRAIAQAASELAAGRAFLFEAVAETW
jgi:alkylation response protein AidB-like acyl-CoA dehydrogenase